jgi:hypothetical protein
MFPTARQGQVAPTMANVASAMETGGPPLPAETGPCFRADASGAFEVMKGAWGAISPRPARHRLVAALVRQERPVLPR